MIVTSAYMPNLCRYCADPTRDAERVCRRCRERGLRLPKRLKGGGWQGYSPSRGVGRAPPDERNLDQEIAAAGSDDGPPPSPPAAAFAFEEATQMVKNAGDPGEVGQLPGMPNFDPRSGTAPGGDTYGRPGGADVGTAYANNGDPYKSSQQPTQTLQVSSTGTEATSMMTDVISGVDQTGPGQTATAGDQSGHVFGPPHHNAARPGPGL